MHRLPPTLGLCALAACGPGADLAQRPAPDGPLTLTEAPDPADRVHGLWHLQAQTEEPVLYEVTLYDGVAHWRTETLGPTTALDHDLVGFRADRHYAVLVERFDADRKAQLGEVVSFDVDVPALPENLPDVTLRHTDGEDRSDTLFPAQSHPDHYWLVRVDGDGFLVWALRTDARTLSAKWLDDGTLLYDDGPAVIRTDPGYEAPVRTEPTGEVFEFHHDVLPREGGGFVALGTRHLLVDDYPTDYELACEPGVPATILDQVVVEVDGNGAQIGVWSTAEALDPSRIGYGALAMENGGYDWGHANALLDDGDSFRVSLRSQDAIVSLDKATGAADWILAPPDGDWDPALVPLLLQPTTADFRWPRHAHAIEPDGNELLLFDNSPVQGTPCGEPADHPTVSRLVALDVNPQAGTVEEAWSWTNGLFSPVMGDADRLGGSRILGVWGQVRFDEQGNLAERGLGEASGRIIEVDRDTGKVRWDLALTSDGADLPKGWSVPRAQRL